MSSVKVLNIYCGCNKCWDMRFLNGPLVIVFNSKSADTLRVIALCPTRRMLYIAHTPRMPVPCRCLQNFSQFGLTIKSH